MDRKLIASGLLEALEDGVAGLRERMPDEYRRAEAIKHSPTWAPFSEFSRVVGPGDTAMRISECAWCGETFVADNCKGRWAECCGHDCANAMRSFRYRRARPELHECKWCGAPFVRPRKHPGYCDRKCATAFLHWRRRRERDARRFSTLPGSIRT